MKATDPVLYWGTVYYAAQGDSNTWVCGRNPKVWLFNWKLKRNSFLVVMSIMMSKVALIFAPVIESQSVTENVVNPHW